MIPVSRSLTGGRRRATALHYPSGVRPGRHVTATVTNPLPFAAGGQVFAGMDPSDPSTHVRRWNPADGMISYLNFNGAALQGSTETGGVYGLPASQTTKAGIRPRRRPR